MKVLDYGAAPASVNFHRGIFEEHLEEAAFLYAQRLTRLGNAEHPWRDAATIESRIEAHIDALVVGREPALKVCATRAMTGEPGELFASLCVFCRQERAPLLAETFKGLDYGDLERVRAVIDALKYELPSSWREYCLRALARCDDKLAPILATVLGYLRMPSDGIVPALLMRAPEVMLPTLLWATGRTREQGALEAVRPFLEAKEASIRSAALRTGLRLQDPEALRKMNVLAQAGECPPLALGLAGGRSAVPILLDMLRQRGTDRDVVSALGLLGSYSVVHALTRGLAVEASAGSAAEALHLITGAPLFDDVFVPEEVDEDELSEKELDVYRKSGKVPCRGDGQPFGTIVHRLSRDPAVWEAWLDKNAAQFVTDRCYRFGKPCSPTVLLESLASEHYPMFYRGLIAEELLVRYGIDLPFEVDMPVLQQAQVIRDAASVVAKTVSVFEPGQWYAASRMVAN